MPIAGKSVLYNIVSDCILPIDCRAVTLSLNLIISIRKGLVVDVIQPRIKKICTFTNYIPILIPGIHSNYSSERMGRGLMTPAQVCFET